MKAICKFDTASEAFEAIDKMSAAGIYSAFSGCEKRGYELLVRDAQEKEARKLLGTANEDSEAQSALAGGK